MSTARVYCRTCGTVDIPCTAITIVDTPAGPNITYTCPACGTPRSTPGSDALAALLVTGGAAWAAPHDTAPAAPLAPLDDNDLIDAHQLLDDPHRLAEALDQLEHPQ